jgi:hypothetical protein
MWASTGTRAKFKLLCAGADVSRCCDGHTSSSASVVGLLVVCRSDVDRVTDASLDCSALVLGYTRLLFRGGTDLSAAGSPSKILSTVSLRHSPGLRFLCKDLAFTTNDVMGADTA